MGEYFSEPKSLEGRVNIQLDLSNYATKPNFKKMQQVLIHQNLLKS